MPGRRRGLIGTLAGALALATLGVGCAGPLTYANGRFLHREHGFSFAAPAPADPPWQRVDQDHALVAFVRPGGARMSVQSECGRAPQDPQLLAHSLLIGVEPLQLRQSGPVKVGPWPGWSQTADLEVDGHARHLKTVTLVAADCTVDFLLVTREDFASAEPAFDAWWQSFEAGAPPPPGVAP